jgi:membrane protein DedA with SNARE-associated domain
MGFSRFLWGVAAFMASGVLGSTCWVGLMILLSVTDRDKTTSGAYFGLTIVILPAVFIACALTGLYWSVLRNGRIE